jgi:phosphoribosylformimino-5-aminoimidazole carboxamide ribonucleotide (ProFAR) isomerase
VLALESRQGNVQTRGRNDHVVGAAVAWAAEMDDAKLAGFLYHDLDAGAGADEVAAVCAAAKRTPVMVRGGVETGKRVEAMRRDGAASVVVEPSFVDASVLMPGRGR